MRTDDQRVEDAVAVFTAAARRYARERRRWQYAPGDGAHAMTRARRWMLAAEQHLLEVGGRVDYCREGRLRVYGAGPRCVADVLDEAAS